MWYGPFLIVTSTYQDLPDRRNFKLRLLIKVRARLQGGWCKKNNPGITENTGYWLLASPAANASGPQISDLFH